MKYLIFIFIIINHIFLISSNDILNNNVIHIFGDSNSAFCFTNLYQNEDPAKLTQYLNESLIYEQSWYTKEHKTYQFIIHWLVGRTLYRIGRDGVEGFNYEDFEVEENQTIVLVFGMIDIMFNHLFKQTLKGKNIDKIIQLLVDNYELTLLGNNNIKQVKTVIMGVLPPYIHEEAQCYFEAYVSGKSFMQHQVEITKKLNTQLAYMARRNNFIFLSINDLLEDAQGCMNSELSEQKCGFHIHPQYNNWVKDRLIELLQECLDNKRAAKNTIIF